MTTPTLAVFRPHSCCPSGDSPSCLTSVSDHQPLPEAPLTPQEFRPEVPDGTPLPVAVSALTKNLRAGREAEAQYWATQIEARFWKYLFRRLAVFAAEDVGIADPSAVQLIQALRSAYEQTRKESRAPTPDPAFVGMAILYLARAPKSREAAEFAQAVAHLQQGEGWAAPVPEEALDLHTEAGRQRMPTSTERLAHWLNVGSRSSTTGPADWTLWIRRWAVRRGALDRAEVEAEAEQWDQDGRLLHGLTGYPARDEGVD